MCRIFEVFVSDKVSFKQVATIVSDCINIPFNKIGTMDECIDRFGTIDELNTSIDIYSYKEGYKTYINVNNMSFELKESQIIKVAYELAIRLNSNVALADRVDYGEFNYIIISPDRKYQKAYEIISREGLNLSPYSEKANISEYLALLDDE